MFNIRLIHTSNHSLTAYVYKLEKTLEDKANKSTILVLLVSSLLAAGDLGWI